MKQKVLFFIFLTFILISCQTTNNITDRQTKSSEILEKPEVDKIKVPAKNDKSKNSKIDTDIDEESNESNDLRNKDKTKQTFNNGLQYYRNQRSGKRRVYPSFSCQGSKTLNNFLMVKFF